MTMPKTHVFRSSHSDVLAEWKAIFAGDKKVARMCSAAEREFKKQYGEQAKLCLRTGYGDSIPVGFFWYRQTKPDEWVWWKRNEVIQPRADKRGEEWRARLREIQAAYPKPRQRLHDRFGVPTFVGLGMQPGLELLDGVLWVFFGDQGTTQWDGGTHFTASKLSEYYAAKEKEETV